MSFLEQELVWRLCRVREARDRDVERILQLAERVDYGVLTKVLVANRLLLICGSRLQSIAGPLVADGFVAALKGMEDAQNAGSLLFEVVTVDLLRAFDEARIRVLPLKGVLLGKRIYGGTSLKPSGDIDLLVARSELPAARQILESRGYTETRSAEYVDGLPELHYSYVSQWPRPPVDLHWRIHWYETAFSERMLAAGIRNEDGIYTASLEDEITALLLFYQRDAFAGLRFVADIAAWWDTYATRIEPGSLGPVVEEFPDLGDLLVASAAMVERMVDAPVSTLLGDVMLRRRRTSWAMHLADWRLGEAQPADQVPNRRLLADMVLIDMMMTPSGQYRAFARRCVLQHPAAFAESEGLPETLRARDHIRRVRRAVGRISKGLAYLLWTGWRLRGGKWLHPLPPEETRLDMRSA